MGRLAGLFLVAMIALGLSGRAYAAPQAEPITVFAASSMTDALTEIGKAYTARTGVKVRMAFGASSAMARQIEAGAPADLFVSADTDWMDYLATRSLIVPGTRENLAGNRLVLIAPSASALRLKIGRGFALARALGPEGRLAIADPETIPAGRYAKAALTGLGVWPSVATRLARADNVRAALLFVDRGEAPLGIVYQTDARLDPRVRILDIFPASSHPAIVYPVAMTRQASPASGAFLTYLKGPAALAIFRRYGFSRP